MVMQSISCFLTQLQGKRSVASSIATSTWCLLTYQGRKTTPLVWACTNIGHKSSSSVSMHLNGDRVQFKENQSDHNELGNNTACDQLDMEWSKEHDHEDWYSCIAPCDTEARGLIKVRYNAWLQAPSLGRCTFPMYLKTLYNTSRTKTRLRQHFDNFMQCWIMIIFTHNRSPPCQELHRHSGRWPAIAPRTHTH